MHIYIFPGFRRTNHTIALYDNNIYVRSLQAPETNCLANVPRHRRSRHQSWRELHSDARLLDNPNSPTMDHNYKSRIADNVNHNDIYNTYPIVTLHLYNSTAVCNIPYGLHWRIQGGGGGSGGNDKCGPNVKSKSLQTLLEIIYLTSRKSYLVFSCLNSKEKPTTKVVQKLNWIKLVALNITQNDASDL